MRRIDGLRMMAMAAAMAVAGGPAQAQPQGGVMKALDFGVLRAITGELDFQILDEGVDQDGDYYLEVETDTGLPFMAYGVICDDDDVMTGCIGLNMVTTFSVKTGQDVHAVVESIQNAFIKVYRSGDDVRIARYVIFDDGITRGNLKANVDVFAEIGDMVWEQLSEDDVLEE